MSSRNVKRRSRIRPIARQHPFDVTVCTTDKFDAGDAVFVENVKGTSRDVFYAENSTFTQVMNAGFPKDQLTGKPLNAEDTILDLRSKENSGDPDATSNDYASSTSRTGAATKMRMLIGFTVTGAEGEPAKGRQEARLAHVPITIAGAQTVSRETFMEVLLLAMGENQSSLEHIEGMLGDNDTLNPGDEFVLHFKLIRVLEKVKLSPMTERHEQPQSVTILISTLS